MYLLLFKVASSMAKESHLAKESIVGQSNVGQTKYCGTANL